MLQYPFLTQIEYNSSPIKMSIHVVPLDELYRTILVSNRANTPPSTLVTLEVPFHYPLQLQILGPILKNLLYKKPLPIKKTPLKLPFTHHHLILISPYFNPPLPLQFAINKRTFHLINPIFIGNFKLSFPLKFKTLHLPDILHQNFPTLYFRNLHPTFSFFDACLILTLNPHYLILHSFIDHSLLSRPLPLTF